MEPADDLADDSLDGNEIIKWRCLSDPRALKQDMAFGHQAVVGRIGYGWQVGDRIARNCDDPLDQILRIFRCNFQVAGSSKHENISGAPCVRP